MTCQDRFERHEGLDLSGFESLKNTDKLKNLTALKILDLRNCENLENVDGLKNCTALKKLYLSGCPKLQTKNIEALQEALPHTEIIIDES